MDRDSAETVDAVVACILVDKSMMQTAVFSASTDPIPELTVCDDSDAYFLYQQAQVQEALGIAPDGTVVADGGFGG